MRTGKRLLAAALLALSFVGCFDQTTSGAGEPLRVYRSDNGKLAAFFPGKLPEPAASDAGTAAPADADAGTSAATPKVINVDPKNRIVQPGQKQGTVAGTISANSAAVALGLDTGSGYWVVPAGNPDAVSGDQLTWSVKCDFSPEIKPGYHVLTVTAIGQDGALGQSSVTRLCVAGRIGDYINACEPQAALPGQPLPQAVISLSWDTEVDLDLQVITPLGRLVTHKQSSTNDPKAAADDPMVAQGTIDRDSNAGCAVDGIRTENLIFDEMPTGTWGIYADLADSCKQPVVHFDVSIYVSQLGTDGYSHLVLVGSRPGVLLSTQATGGATTVGTYLFEVNF